MNEILCYPVWRSYECKANFDGKINVFIKPPPMHKGHRDRKTEPTITTSMAAPFEMSIRVAVSTSFRIPHFLNLADIPGGRLRGSPVTLKA